MLQSYLHLLLPVPQTNHTYLLVCKVLMSNSHFNTALIHSECSQWTLIISRHCTRMYPKLFANSSVSPVLSPLDLYAQNSAPTLLFNRVNLLFFSNFHDIESPLQSCPLYPKNVFASLMLCHHNPCVYSLSHCIIIAY